MSVINEWTDHQALSANQEQQLAALGMNLEGAGFRARLMRALAVMLYPPQRIASVSAEEKGAVPSLVGEPALCPPCLLVWDHQDRQLVTVTISTYRPGFQMQRPGTCLIVVGGAGEALTRIKQYRSFGGLPVLGPPICAPGAIG
ncbi:hypothetical protein J5X84_39305 [Streptosporangiaceae bacterium NEAU-GS5]|nr:hypothetical protein [Streptosporangiaceae bacterium NEAU-GS5]